jgi:hypothetical protein
VRYPEQIAVSIFFLLLILSLRASGQKRLELHGLKVNFNYAEYEAFDASIANAAPLFILKNKKSHLHEIELASFDFDKRAYYQGDSYGTMQHIQSCSRSVGIRYQFTFQIVRKENQKLVPQIGVSFLSLYQYKSTFPLLPSTFTKREITWWREFLSIVPQARYNFHRRIFLDVGLSLDIVYMQLATYLNHNKALPPDQQKFHDNGVAFTKFHDLIRYPHLRAGIGIKI